MPSAARGRAGTIVGRVSARARVITIVALAAGVVAAATVAVAALTGGEPGQTRGVAEPCPQGPPLELDLGVRTDPEAVALRRGSELYRSRGRGRAREIFSRWRSTEARVAAAIAGADDRRLTALQQLARLRPRSGAVRLHLGYAHACAGDLRRARAEWRTTKRVAPDSAYAVRAGDRLHPEYVPGLPGFVAAFMAPRAIRRLPAPAQVRALARSARSGGARAKLLYGAALQRLQRSVSARRVFGEAARLAPGDAEAQVAAALAQFDKDRPARAFGRLGPLTRRFPRAATVRFHLGLLLLWIGRVDEGKQQLERAQRLQPSSPIAREASAFLRRLDDVGTGDASN